MRRSSSAAEKVRGSVPWALGEAVINVVYGLGAVALIGLLVPPAELGRASLATATTLLVEALTAFGLQESIIRARSGDTLTTDATFALATVTALLGYILAVAIAVLLAWTMSAPDIVTLTMLAALTIPLNAAAAIPTGILARKLRAKQLSLRIMASKLCSIVVLGACASLGLGATAVVGAFVTGPAASCILVWSVLQRKPKFRPDVRISKEMLSFGIFISLENLSWNATIRLFAILFGQFHGLASLGLFQFAARLADEMAALIQIIVARVGLSFFSHIERRGEDSRPAFKTGTLLLMTIATPLFVGMAVIAPVLLPTIFGERWVKAVPFLQILSLSWPFTFARVLISPVLRARGKTFIYTAGLAISSSITLTACYLMRNADPTTGALSYVVSQVFAVPYGMYLTKRFVGVPIGDQLRIFLFPISGGVLVWAVASALGSLTEGWTVPTLSLLAMIVGSGAAYMGLVALNPTIRALWITLQLPVPSIIRSRMIS